MRTMVYKDPVCQDNPVTLIVKDLTHDKLEAYRAGYDEYYNPRYTKRYLYETSKEKRYTKGQLVEIAFCMCLGIVKRYLHQNGYDDFIINVDYIRDLRNKIDVSVKFMDWYTKKTCSKNVQLKYGILSDANDFAIEPNAGSKNVQRFLEFYSIHLPNIDAFDYECMLEDIDDIFKLFNV